VHERFRRVIAQHAGWRQRQGAEGQTSLLVVDSDPNFRQFAIPLLEGDFVISQAISGAHALRVFQESELKPTTILVAEGLPMVSETQVVNLISKLSIESRTGIPSFWLVTDSELPHEKASLRRRHQTPSSPRPSWPSCDARCWPGRRRSTSFAVTCKRRRRSGW
jgi:hypothetical protein